MDNIRNLENLLERIDKTRNYMNDMIREKLNLLDPEIVAVSQVLDSILNEYNKIVCNKVDK